MMNKETLLKIKKLMALANGSSFQEEAASALGKAQALMLKHKVTQAMLEDTVEEDGESIESFYESPLNEEDRGKRKLSMWKYRLTSVLCQFNGCYVFQSGCHLILVGKPSDVDAVRYLYGYCRREVDRLTALNCKGHGRTYANNFRIGCVEAIREAMNFEQAEIRKQFDHDKDEKSLVVIDKTLAKIQRDRQDSRAFATNKFRLRSGSGSSYRGDSAARNAGKSAGSSIYKGGAGSRLSAPQRKIGS